MIEEVGLGSLLPVLRHEILAQIRETLERRVGLVLAQRMTDEHLAGPARPTKTLRWLGSGRMFRTTSSSPLTCSTS